VHMQRLARLRFVLSPPETYHILEAPEGASGGLAGDGPQLPHRADLYPVFRTTYIMLLRHPHTPIAVRHAFGECERLGRAARVADAAVGACDGCVGVPRLELLLDMAGAPPL
jgi:hypothetical protein